MLGSSLLVSTIGAEGFQHIHETGRDLVSRYDESPSCVRRADAELTRRDAPA
jgi:hypothetical protein